MNHMNDEHPVDTVLLEHALYNEHTDIKEHIESCPSCSRQVKEARILNQVLQSIPEEDVPEKLRGAIIKSIKNKHKPLTQSFEYNIETWYRNPLIIGIGIILAVLFFYIFFVFIL